MKLKNDFIEKPKGSIRGERLKQHLIHRGSEAGKRSKPRKKEKVPPAHGVLVFQAAAREQLASL